MSALTLHLASGVTTVCRVWVVRRSDGLVLGFTDHDRSLTIDGVLCRASTGMTAGTLATSTGLSVDNAEVSGALSDEAIREADIRAGRWDDAAIVCYRVNWKSIDEREVAFRGTLGEISWSGGAFSVELRGVAEALNKPRGRVYQARCDANLGDARCRKVLEPSHWVEVELIDVRGGQVFAIDEIATSPVGWFERGRLIVLSGAAIGMSERIKTDRFVDGRRELSVWLSLGAAVQTSDRVRLEVGCDKRIETCRTRFSNYQNFRGFPHIPGEEWLMAYPKRDGRDDGGRL